MDLPDLLKRFEKSAIETALLCTNGNVLRAGKILGMNRTTVHSRCSILGIDIEDFRDTFMQEIVTTEVVNKTAISVQCGELKNEMVFRVVDVCEGLKWNRTATAKELGISVKTVRKYLDAARSLGEDIPKGKWGGNNRSKKPD